MSHKRLKKSEDEGLKTYVAEMIQLQRLGDEYYVIY